MFHQCENLIFEHAVLFLNAVKNRDHAVLFSSAFKKYRR